MYCMHAKQKGYRNVRVSTPDSDIFFICLYYGKTELQDINVFIDTENSNNKRLINVTHYVQSVRIRSYSGPHSLAFGLNTGKCGTE